MNTLFDFNHYNSKELNTIFSIQKNDEWSTIEKKIKDFENKCLKRLKSSKDKILLREFINKSLSHYKPSAIETKTIEKLLSWYENEMKHLENQDDKKKLKHQFKKVLKLIEDEPSVISMNDNKKELNDPSMNIVHQLSYLKQNRNDTNKLSSHIYTEPYQYGELNPIHRPLNTHLLNIDTIFCNPNPKDEDLTSDFVYTLPTPIHNVISMRLSSTEIPNTIFMFDEHLRSNIFFLEVGISANSVHLSESNDPNEDISRVEYYPITIPEGNYESDEFVTRMNEVFVNTSNNIPDNNRLNMRYVICEFDSVDSRVNFRFRNAFDEADAASQFVASQNPDDLSQCYISLNFNVPDLEFERTAGWTLGYRKPFYKVYYNDENAVIKKWIDEADYETLGDNIDEDVDFSANTYRAIYGNIKAECIYGSSKLNYVFVSVEDYTGSHSTSIISCLPKHILDEKILGRVVFKFGSYTFNFEDLRDRIYKQRDYYGPVKIEKLRIRLMDKYGYLVNLKGSDFSLLLELKTIYS